MNNNKIIKKFIEEYLYDLLYDKHELANMSFNFKEEEAKKTINSILIDNINNGRKFNRMNEIYKAINSNDFPNPILEVSDYKSFFASMEKFKKLLISEYENYTNNGNYSFVNQIYKYIWLRMTPDDFKNPEQFLNKQIDILKDKTFNKYNKKNKCYDFDLIDNSELLVMNTLANQYDESVKEIIFNIVSDYYKYTLPIVRYGIYEKNNKKICEIGSIQNKEYKDTANDKLYNILNRLKYKLNKSVPQDLIGNVEPLKLMSLIIFIKLLIENDIHTISIPSIYVLDYEYHEKRNIIIESIFNSKFTEEFKKNNPKEYDYELNEYLKKINKQDIISANKTTNFIHLFERLLYHLEDARVVEYPNEVSSYMKIEIPSLNNVNGDYVKKLIK